MGGRHETDERIEKKHVNSSDSAPIKTEQIGKVSSPEKVLDHMARSVGEKAAYRGIFETPKEVEHKEVKPKKEEKINKQDGSITEWEGGRLTYVDTSSKQPYGRGAQRGTDPAISYDSQGQMNTIKEYHKDGREETWKRGKDDSWTNGHGERRSDVHFDKDGTLHYTDKAGTSWTERPNGQVEARYSDGRVVQGPHDGARITRDKHGPLSEITDAKGNTTKFQYDTSGHAFISKDGHNVAVQINPDHSFSYKDDKSGEQVTHYQDGGTIGRNEKGQVTSVEDAKGNRYKFHYDAQGQVDKMTTPEGETWTKIKPHGASAIRDWKNSTGEIYSLGAVTIDHGSGTIAVETKEGGHKTVTYHKRDGTESHKK